MTRRSKLLLVDAAVNLVLGVILLFFPGPVVRFLGVPRVESAFYPSLLGAVLIGIAIALVWECVRRARGLVGLGLGGAMAVNLCAAVVLAFWLRTGLEIPLRGRIFLWSLVAVLVVISGLELLAHFFKGTAAADR